MRIFLLGVLLIVLLGIVGFALSPDRAAEEESNQAATQQQEQQSAEPGELVVEDLEVGEGTEAVAGKVAVVHYTGTLLNGTKFDSSLDRGEPFAFSIGAGQVIQGWEQGILGMKVGGKRNLTIPPELAYGNAAGHPLQEETLVFEVELLDVREE